MLRESSKLEGKSADLNIVTNGRETTGGIIGEKNLIAFAEASLGDDSNLINQCREALTAELGSDAMVDAAGVIANFQRMTRIADGTGIPLDPPMAMMTADIRLDLGINQYASAERTPPVGLLKRWLGKLLRMMLPLILNKMAGPVKQN